MASYSYSSSSNTFCFEIPNPSNIGSVDSGEKTSIHEVLKETKRHHEICNNLSRVKRLKKKERISYSGYSFNDRVSSIVNSQIQKTLRNSKMVVDIDEWQKVIARLDQLEKQNQELQNHIKELNSKIENSIILPTNSQIPNGIILAVPPEIIQTSSSDDMQMTSNNNEQTIHANVDDYYNNSRMEPTWTVEKEKCIHLLKKAENHIPIFLSSYLPQIYNASEIISPITFPEVQAKNIEIQSVIHYFWKNQSTPDFYAKLIEKELQHQRYKVTRKIYQLLKFADTCIMRKDGKLYDSKCDRVTQRSMSYSDQYFEWLIPDEIIFDDYVVAAKKDTNLGTHIYKLDLALNSMTLLHTKRK